MCAFFVFFMVVFSMLFDCWYFPMLRCGHLTATCTVYHTYSSTLHSSSPFCSYSPLTPLSSNCLFHLPLCPFSPPFLSPFSPISTSSPIGWEYRRARESSRSREGDSRPHYCCCCCTNSTYCAVPCYLYMHSMTDGTESESNLFSLLYYVLFSHSCSHCKPLNDLFTNQPSPSLISSFSLPFPSLSLLPFLTHSPFLLLPLYSLSPLSAYLSCS